MKNYDFILGALMLIGISVFLTLIEGKKYSVKIYICLIILAILLSSKTWKSSFEILVAVLVVGIFTLLFHQILVFFVLTIGRKKWRELERKRFQKGIYTPPEGLINLIFGPKRNFFNLSSKKWNDRLNRFFDTLFTSEFYIFGEFVKFFFERQYRAIIKPEQLGIDSSAPEPKNRTISKETIAWK
jgi:hypothetical protein